MTASSPSRPSEAHPLIVGVTGSISAYKAPTLLNRLKDHGIPTRVMMSASATRFITPMSLAVTSNHPVISDLWSEAERGQVGHVQWADRAFGLLVAPATADCIQRLAHGFASDPISATALSLAPDKPKWIAPAMEPNMWNHPQTQQAVHRLNQMGWRIIAPLEGKLASGKVGTGRLPEPEDIARQIQIDIECHPHFDALRDQTVLVTAGPTREALDPIRFLSNPSTGKMGIALAEAAAAHGADVQLILGPTTEIPKIYRNKIEVHHIQSTQHMHDECHEVLTHQQPAFWVMAAAPCDYRPSRKSLHKIKKSEHTLDVGFERTVDILSTLTPEAEKGSTRVIGFAAETQNVETFAAQKLAEKRLHAIVANKVGTAESGFGVDHNSVIVLNRQGQKKQFETMPKHILAVKLWQHILAMEPAPTTH